jgi:hypothetical protein
MFPGPRQRGEGSCLKFQTAFTHYPLLTAIQVERKLFRIANILFLFEPCGEHNIRML